MSRCVFCEIVAGRAPATIVEQTNMVTILVPLGPVVDGHVLIIPNKHLVDAAEKPAQTAGVFLHAAAWAKDRGRPFNLITSAGREATQSIFHLHVHYIPRTADDQLMVPWGTLHGENPQDAHRCKGIVELETALNELSRCGGCRSES